MRFNAWPLRIGQAVLRLSALTKAIAPADKAVPLAG